MASPFDLNGKTFLVTGASSGIGRQCCISISQMGGKLILTARREEELEITRSKLEGEGHTVRTADLTQEAQRVSLLSDLQEFHGIVHCAGKVIVRPLRYLDAEELNEMMLLNYQAAALLTNAILKKRLIKKGGSFVFVSSLGSSEPYFGGSGYCASKGAITAFSKTVALECCKRGIRSNVVSPASIKTDIYDEMGSMLSQEFIDKYAEKYPLGVGLPEDVANTVVFLLSEAARWITGMDIKMDGGLLLNR